MTRVEHMIAIGPPIDEVFHLITEALDDPVWLSSVLDVHAPEAPSPSAANASRRDPSAAGARRPGE